MRFLLPLLLLFATSASARCPTAADLARGIRITTDDGGVQIVRSTDDAVILNIEDKWPNGEFGAEDYAWGLFDIRTTATSEQFFSDATDYGLEPNLLPRPVPATRVTFSHVWSPGFFLPLVARHEYRMGDLGTIALAGCRFRAFEIERRSTYSSTSISQPPPVLEPSGEWAYLVDLGFALQRRGYSYDDPREVEVLSIEPLP